MRFQHYYNKIYFLMEGYFKDCWMPVYKWQTQKELDQPVISCNIIRKEHSWFFIGDQLTIKANLRTTADITIQNRDLSPVTYDYFNILEILARLRLFFRSSNYSWVAPPC